MTTMTIGKAKILSTFILVIWSAVGCSNTPYADPPQAGQAVRKAWTAQTLNADADPKKWPPADSDGVAMKSAVDRYQSSFDKPPAPVNVMNIGIGGSAGTSGR